MSGVRDPERSETSRRTRSIVAVVVVIAAAVIIAAVFLLVPQEGTPSVAPQTPTPAASYSTTPSSEPSASPNPSEAPQPEATVVEGSLDDDLDVAPGVSVVVRSIEAVEGEATGPGDIAGPAVRVTVVFRNESGVDIDLTNAHVNLAYGTQALPASPLAEPGGARFAETLPSGEEAEGVFVFGVPADERAEVRVEVDYTAGAPVLVFSGEAPR